MKVGQRQSIYIILGMMILVLAACGSSEKDGSSGVRDSDHTERTTSSWEGEPEEENFEIREQKEQKIQSQQSKFSGVLWFQDDTGKNTQLHDGFLYAYWGNRLCRYNLETLEETVLYEALSAQTGDFCIYEGYVYFLVRRDVTFLDGPITMLYRVSCDGTELTKLQEFRIGNGYRLDAYDDILYLLLEYQNYDDEKNIYLRIGDDGVEQIPERETLYGILPEGYEADRQVVQYRNMPGLPYLMRNFGYMFLWDVEERLFRYAPESGVPELFELPEKAEGMVLYLISDSILFADKEGIWYRISLNDPTEIVTIDASCFEKGEELYGESFRYADENGLYFVKNKVGYVDQVRYVNLIRVSWEGKYERLYTYLETRDLTTALHYYDEVKLTYFGGDYFYYNNITQGDGVILRVPLKLDVAEWEPEQVTVYYESPIKDISWYEKVVTEFHAEGLSGSFTVEETYLTDDSGGSEKINQSLEMVYARWQEQIQTYEQIVKEKGNEDYYSWDYRLVTLDLKSSIHYLDQNYIGFSFYWTESWATAAHPIYGSQYMVFDRNTGHQVSLEEFTGLSEEELCRIIVPYVEASSEWPEESRLGRESILEDWRFFLSNEGIGIHYDIYEITSYAGGDRNIVVPYEAFGE